MLEYMLEAADSSITYRSRYYTTLQPIAVLEVLMADETNPRSLDFQLSHVADLYGKIPRHNAEDLQSIKNAVASVRNFNLENMQYPLPGTIHNDGDSGERRRLRQVLTNLNEFLPVWSSNLSDLYFAHARTLPVTIDIGE